MINILDMCIYIQLANIKHIYIYIYSTIYIVYIVYIVYLLHRNELFVN